MYYIERKSYTYAEKNNKKMVTSLLITGLILVIMTLMALSSYGSKPIKYDEIVIKNGDTLWGIVETINKNNEDPRKLIGNIKRINNLDNVVLQPGQIIKVPVQ